jgi:hypothetical protein
MARLNKHYELSPKACVDVKAEADGTIHRDSHTRQVQTPQFNGQTLDEAPPITKPRIFIVQLSNKVQSRASVLTGASPNFRSRYQTEMPKHLMNKLNAIPSFVLQSTPPNHEPIRARSKQHRAITHKHLDLGIKTH